MCNNNNVNDNASSSPLASSSSLVPYSLKTLQAAVAAAVNVADPHHAAYMAAHVAHGGGPTASQLTQAALDHYRMQLYNYVSYADRLRYHHQGHHHQALTHQAHYAALPLGPTSAAAAAAEVYMPYAKFDPCRAYRMHQEEPKPQHSYIGLIGMAILSAPDKKLVLSDIYQHILDNYSYFRNRGPGWRNSIRHNLSLNDCFVKAGRSANGKGHFWAIHPANLEDFKKGDFRRRKAQRRVRKHLGLSIPEDDDSLSPPPPAPAPGPQPPATPHTLPNPLAPLHQQQQQAPSSSSSWGPAEKPDSTTPGAATVLKKRFDMDSILAPERSSRCACCDLASAPCHLPKSGAPGWSLLSGAEARPEAEKNEERLMLDECSSSSLLTEARTEWALPADECDDFRPPSRSCSSNASASSGSCSAASSSGGYEGPTTTDDKGPFALKGLQGYHEAAAFLAKRPSALLDEAVGPLLLNGKPNSISDSDKRVSGNQA